MLDKRITVSVYGSDEVGRARLARRLRGLDDVRVVRAGAEVEVLLLGRQDRNVLRGAVGGVPVVVVAEELGETELMAIADFGVWSVLLASQASPRRLARAIHSAAGCCPPGPLRLPRALV
ncbi:hypothetical protein [Streptomyces orinoci]|uniref:Uncharacterized protein n=1 Tax=Streptomyces orinoci TaxID=67339 RepID=A0ABV3K2F0_STRON|nr:hypothetical protein [Streptomyces orinoci]